MIIHFMGIPLNQPEFQANCQFKATLAAQKGGLLGKWPIFLQWDI